MAHISIDAAGCTGCGLCAGVCPFGIIKIEKGKASPLPAAKNRCLRCGHCAACCPNDCIRIDGRGTAGKADARAVTADALALLMKSRRSIRVFRSEPVPEKRLRDILDVVRYAPTARNGEDVRWIVMNGREKVGALAGFIAEELRRDLKDMTGAAACLAERGAGYDLMFRGAPCVIFNHASADYELSPADSIIAMTYLELMLPAYDLGATWTGFALRVLNRSSRVREYLGIPEGRMAYAGLCLGFSAENYPNIPARREVQAVFL